MTQADTTELAGAALRIRQWALVALSSSDSVPDPPDGVPPRAWELFLHAERCALPLRRRMASAGPALPPDAARIIGLFALEEMQRVVSAKAQLRFLSRRAAQASHPLVILKGGVAVVDDHGAVDLADIDVWAEPGVDRDIVDALSAGGFTSKPHASGHHHPAHTSEQLVAVEVHHRIPYAELDGDWLKRTRTLHADLPGLQSLSPGEHLWHVLIHATVHHIERRGRIRDVLLVAHALESCSGSEREMIRNRAKQHEETDALLSMLAMAEQIGSQTSGVVPDAFPAVAAVRYLHALAPSSGPNSIRSSIATSAALDGWQGCRDYIARVAKTWDTPIPLRGLRVLQQKSPRIGGGLVIALRILKRVLALGVALPNARRARDLAARVHGDIA